MRNTFFALTVALLAACGSIAQADIINELQPNPAGTDPATQSIELKGIAGESFIFNLVSLESDAGGTAGMIDRASEVSGTYDSNGLAVVTINDLENPSFTLLLVQGLSGVVGDDLDTDDDGILDLTPWASFYDAVGIPDTDDDTLYGASLGGVDLAYIGTEPDLTFRDGTTDAWYSVAGGTTIFDADGNELDPNTFDSNPLSPTFGAINPSIAAVPEPGSAAVLGVLALGTLVVRRRRQS